MMQDTFLLSFALAFLPTPILMSLWLRQRERLQLRKVAISTPKDRFRR